MHYILDSIEPLFEPSGNHMKSITIHGIDDELVKEIEKRANEEGTSLNHTIKQLLRQVFGLGKNQKPVHDFSDLCGVWSAAELREFEDKTADFARIQNEDWR